MPTPSAMTTLTDASNKLLGAFDNWQTQKANLPTLIEQYKQAFTAAYTEAKPKGAADMAAVVASEKATVSAIQMRLINFNKATYIPSPDLTTAPSNRVEEAVKNLRIGVYLGEKKLQEKAGVDEQFKDLAGAVGQIVRHVITVTDPEEYRGFKPEKPPAPPANGFVPPSTPPAPPAGPAQKEQNSR